MADWDPYSDEAAQAGARSLEEDTYELPGSQVRVEKKDYNRFVQRIWGELKSDEPWQEMPDPKPDLSWHEPSCTLEAWAHSDVKCELGAGVAYFTLNRPEDGNRLAGGIMAALADAVVLLHRRRDLRVAVFTGEGALLSCGGDPRGEAGGGLEEGPREACDRLAWRAFRQGAFPEGEVRLPRLLQARLWQALATVPQFTICVANGSAMGDGLALVACTDYVVAMEGCFFSLADIKSGLVPAAMAPYVLAKTGTGVTKRLFCTCENLGAATAVTEGLVDETVPSLEEADRLVRGLCERLTACGPRSVEAAKELVMGVAGQQIVEPLMFYTSMMAQRSLNSEEAHAASAAVAASRAKPWEETPIKPLR